MTILNIKTNNMLREKTNHLTKVSTSLLIFSFLIVLLISQLGFNVKVIEAQEPFLSKVVSNGGSYSLTLMENGTVWSWGYNNNGQLGDGTTVTRHTPVQVKGLNNIVEISAGGAHAVALKSDGTVWAWGSNNYGQLGDGIIKKSKMPLKVNGLPEIVKISAGSSHSMALSSDGTVWAWGQNFTGRLGDGTIENSYQPVQVVDLYEVVDICAGGSHSLALKSDGTVWAWGNNFDGQLGNGSYWDSSSVPIQTDNISNAVAISAGNVHSLAVLSDGTVWAWGNNYNAQLGNGNSKGNHPIPAKVEGLDNVGAITANGHSTIALKSDGTAWGWGSNYYGQIGDGTTESYQTVPTMVNGLNNIKNVSISGWHSLAVLDDGTVWGWGFNQTGQVGDNTTIDRHEPVQVLFNLTNTAPVVATEIDARINQAKIAPESLEIGDEISIQVIVENSGNLEHQFTVLGKLWKPNNNFVEPDQTFAVKVFLENGEERTLSWNQIVDEIGEWKYDFTLWKEEPHIEGNLLDQYPKPAGVFYVRSQATSVPLPETTHKVAYIPVKYKGSDSPLPDFTVANLMTRAGMVSYYYYQQSYGAVSIESEFVYDYWKELPNTYSYYEQQASGGPFWVLGTRVIADAIEIAGINVDDYDAVVVIQPALKRAFADPFISTTTVFLSQTDNYGTWAHELGHAVFKWPDYYHEKDRLNTRGATGSWCLMGTGNQLSPPAPIMIYNKVSAGWLRFKDIYLNVVYPLNITLIENLNQGNEVYRYNTKRDDIKYIIIEGRKPTDGVIVEDSWYKPPFYKPTMLDDEGIQLYQVEIKNGDEYVYYIESKRSNNIFQRVTLVSGDSYDCDLCSTSFNALNEGTEIQINIQPLPVTSRKIFKLSAVDYQYSNVKDIAATPNITENVFDIDLHLYTNDGLKVGMDYETGEYLLQIPGARSSGNIPEGGIEWVSIPDNIEAFYKIDTTPMEIWLAELVRLGQFDAEDIEGIDFEIEATIQEIVVDEHGERSVSEITESLSIAYNNPLENNLFSEGFSFILIILVIIIIVLIIIAIIIRGVLRDRKHYKKW